MSTTLEQPLLVAYPLSNLTGNYEVDTKTVARAIKPGVEETVREAGAGLVAWAYRDAGKEPDTVTLVYDLPTRSLKTTTTSPKGWRASRTL